MVFLSLKLWLVFGFFLVATSLRMYATCQQLQAQAQAHAVAASGLLRHTELRLQMPPSIAFATRGRLQGLRLQLALLDREFDDLGIRSSCLLFAFSLILVRIVALPFLVLSAHLFFSEI